MTHKLYDIWDGYNYLGRGNIHWAVNVTGMPESHIYRVKDTAVLRDRYIVHLLPRDASEKVLVDLPAGWTTQWDETVAAIREVIDTERLIRDKWDDAVRPFRKPRLRIWRI